jgi:hypothetical protein
MRARLAAIATLAYVAGLCAGASAGVRHTRHAVEREHQIAREAIATSEALAAAVDNYLRGPR